MTQDKTPTDADLQSAYDSVPAHGNQQDVHIAGLRAVLAKWGSPVVAGEQPTAWGIFDSQGFYEAALDEASAKRFCDHYNARPNGPLKPFTYKALFATPQPTQAQAGAVPLTDEQIEAAVETWFTNAKQHDFHGRMRFAITAAHGIKEGGQHAAD